MNPNEPLDEKSWQFKVIQVTRAHQTVMGSLVCAAMGKNRGHLPAFGSRAHIDKDGMIRALFLDKGGVLHKNYAVMPTRTLSENLTRVAMDAGLDDAQAVEFFTLIRGWIYRDDRAQSNMERDDATGRRM